MHPLCFPLSTLLALPCVCLLQCLLDHYYFLFCNLALLSACDSIGLLTRRKYPAEIGEGKGATLIISITWPRPFAIVVVHRILHLQLVPHLVSPLQLIFFPSIVPRDEFNYLLSHCLLSSKFTAWCTFRSMVTEAEISVLLY